MRRLIERMIPALGARARQARAGRGNGAVARRRMLRRVGAAAVVLALVAAAGSWWWLSGRAAEAWSALVDRAVETTVALDLTVDAVLVSGRSQTDRTSLLDALGVEVGEPILSVDIETARQRIAALPWVDEVAVERRLPGIIVVELVERRPLALWQKDGEVFVVDTNGAVIPGARASSFAGLLLVVGPDAPTGAAELLAVMDATPALADRVAAAVRVGGRRWNLKLADGIEIELPERDLEGAWRRLVELQDREQLLARDVIAVDLRMPDRLVLRLTPEARARMAVDPEAGEET